MLEKAEFFFEIAPDAYLKIFITREDKKPLIVEIMYDSHGTIIDRKQFYTQNGITLKKYIIETIQKYDSQIFENKKNTFSRLPKRSIGK